MEATAGFSGVGVGAAVCAICAGGAVVCGTCVGADVERVNGAYAIICSCRESVSFRTGFCRPDASASVDAKVGCSFLLSHVHVHGHENFNHIPVVS